MLAILFAVSALVILLSDVFLKGYKAFIQTEVRIEVSFDQRLLGVEELSAEALRGANWNGVIKSSLREMYPDVSSRADKRALYALVSESSQWQLAEQLEANPQWLNETHSVWLRASSDVDMWYKYFQEESIGTRLNEKQIAWTEGLIEQDSMRSVFNRIFFQNGASRNPEEAGIRGALIGSLLTLLVTFSVSFPIAVATAVYLEEFAPKNRFTQFVEVNINNLAAVPSITFGLLGLAVFLQWFGMPRSAPLVGGLVLSLMTLPTIIIAARAAIKSVPPSIRDAALGLGASKTQVVFHHVVPLAMPGILTGTIIGLAQALGETAPLMMIGMVAFIVDVPSTITDPSAVLPVQIFLWSDAPERGYMEKTSGAILVLLMFLMIMNAFAVWLRKRLEKRW
jgi:phosphate transport system permease protein